MKNYIQNGDNITVIAAVKTASGDFTAIGNLYGVATADAEIGEPVTLVRKGAFELPKTSAQAWAVGAKIYFDGTVCTSVASTNLLIGVAVAVAADPSDTGLVVLK
jgi:predicted RecA/RadA family phage recombinase